MNRAKIIWNGSRSEVSMFICGDQMCVKKKYVFHDDLKNEKNIYNILHEKGMRNIPRLIDSGPDYIILSYIEGDILRNVVKNSGFDDICSFFGSGSDRARDIRDQMITIINDLHKMGMAHGNIKQSQFIVDKNNALYIFDFAQSALKGAPFYELFAKYDNDVLESYLTGKKARRPSKSDFYSAKIKKWLKVVLKK